MLENQMEKKMKWRLGFYRGILGLCYIGPK